jgi:hypothetical protein
MHLVMAKRAQCLQVSFDVLSALHMIFDVMQFRVARVGRVPLIV